MHVHHEAFDLADILESDIGSYALSVHQLSCRLFHTKRHPYHVTEDI